MRAVASRACAGLVIAAALGLAAPVRADSNLQSAPLQTAPLQIAQGESEIDYWNGIKNSKKPEDYQAYLDKYPNGNFADLAKLRLKKYAAPAPMPAVDPQQADIAAWNAIKSSKNAEDYKAYLDHYPNGEFVDLAKLRIEQLSPPAPAPQPAAPAPQPVAPATVEAPAPAPAFDAKDATVYAKNGGQVRAAPDPKAALLTKLKTNTEVHATGVSSDGKWWRVEIPGGQIGYMHRTVVSQQAVTVAPPGSKKAAPAPAAAKAPAGPDEDVCKPTSAAAGNDRVAACERLLAKAGDDQAKLAAVGDLAAALAQAKRFDEAIRKYEQAAQLAPRDASIYYRIGLVRLDQLHFPEARAAFEKAAQIDSQNPDIVFERGVSYIGLGDFEKAKLEVKRALLTKDDAAYYEKLGGIELGRGDLAAAKTALERGRKADPGRHSLILAAISYFTGATDQAAAQVAAVREEPTAALWNALIRKSQGDATGAVQALEAGRAAADEDAWPGPVFDALSGKLDPAKARAAAKSKDANTQFQQLCALNFYLGEWAYLSGDKETARAALKAAIDTRAYHLLEYAAAKARLANMGG